MKWIIIIILLVVGFSIGVYENYRDDILVPLNYIEEKTGLTLEQFNRYIMEKETKQQYQGPVPEGYDEEYFRETGITKHLE